MTKPENVSSAVKNFLPPDDCLTKTVKSPGGSITKCVSVPTNCQGIAHVTRKLINLPLGMAVKDLNKWALSRLRAATGK